MYSTEALSRGKNILVVDGQIVNLRLLTSILSGEGYIVRPVPNAELALSSVFCKTPDLILTDIMMPRMNGYEFCRRIKGDRHSASIPVIFLSASFDPEVREKALAAGGSDFISKPFRQQELLQSIRDNLPASFNRTAISSPENADAQRTVVFSDFPPHHCIATVKTSIAPFARKFP